LRGIMASTLASRKSVASCEGTTEAIRQLARRRVPILAGTDAPAPGQTYGASLHGELALLVRAGLTPLQALAAATSAPARAFRLADRGRIRPGLRADLTTPPTGAASSFRMMDRSSGPGKKTGRGRWSDTCRTNGARSRARPGHR
jgi:cytosine/adenosine deaminase-related metal-dependent hydrolase